MVYGRFQRTLLSSNNGVQTDIVCGIRGGIVISLQMQVVPNAYWDQGTADERIRDGSLKVYVADALTLESLLGQVTQVDSLISIPPNFIWRWDNPYGPEMLAAASLVSKLGIATTITPQPAGLFTGTGIRFFVSTDPLLQVPHKLQVELDVVTFDVSGF